MSRLDFIIFGATGFAGKNAVEETIRICKIDKSLAWGISGRSHEKLKELLEILKVKTGEDLSNIKIIVADVENEESLKAMTAQGKVLVNCCGPYRHHGEPVIRACIATSTHQVDISAEPQFMDKMHLEYNKQALEAGVYIVNACGFDCIPNDLGVVYLKQNFKGQLNTVESYVSTSLLGNLSTLGSPIVNYGTFSSLVHTLANWHELDDLKTKMFPKGQPKLEPCLKDRRTIHKSGNRWYLPYPGADDTIVYRSQGYFHETEKERPIQFKCYAGGFPNCFVASVVYIGAHYLHLMCKIGCTRKLLLNHPKVLSLGLVSTDGPADEVSRKATFEFLLKGEGWDETVTDVTAIKPNKKMTAKVSGTNPAYGATVTALIYSAITILREQDKMPKMGGVLTPGIAFSKTNLINILNVNQLTFEIVHE